MAIGDFLGGGAMAFIIVLVAVFILWILYKVILAPIFSVFGWGKQTMGKLGERAMNNMVDNWTKDKNEGNNEKNESAQEGQAGQLGAQGKDLAANASGLLGNVASTGNFSEEKVSQFKLILNEQEKVMSQQKVLFNKLYEEYHLAQKNFKKGLNNLRDVIDEQSRIERAALEQARQIEKFGQTDPSLGRIIGIVEEIKPLAKGLIAFDAQEREHYESLQSLSKNRSVMTNDILRLVHDSKSVFFLANEKKVAPLQQVPLLQQNQKLIEEKMSQLVAYTDEAKKININLEQIMNQIQQIDAKIIPLLKEQQELIQASKAYLEKLKLEGAIPPKFEAAAA